MPRKREDRQLAMRIANRVGRRMRALRKGIRLTQEQVATQIGLTSEAYARIERGYSLPSFPTLMRACEALGTTPDTLLLDAGGDLDGEDAEESLVSPVAEARKEIETVVLDLQHVEPRLVRDVARLLRTCHEAIERRTPG